MITFRCTVKALKRFRLEPVESPLEPSGVLGDWYVNLLNVGPQRCVLCVSERSLLPVIVPARDREFPARFPSYLHGVLCAVDIPFPLAAREAEEAKEYAIARTANRRVLGVMNEYAFLAEHHLIDEGQFATSLSLSETPLKPIGYDWPANRTRDLFSTSAYQSRPSL